MLDSIRRYREITKLKVAPYSFWTARELISKISRWRELSISTLKSRAESRSKMPTIFKINNVARIGSGLKTSIDWIEDPTFPCLI